MSHNLPSALEAEKNVLGAVLLSPRAFLEVADLVRAKDFHHPAHEAIYAAMVALDEAARPIDAVAVGEQMRTDDTIHRLRAFSGESYFSELTSAVVTTENVAYYARIVAGKALIRRGVEAGEQIAALGGDGIEPEDFAQQAETLLYQATAAHVRAPYEAVQSVLSRAIRAIEARYDRKQAITGVPSGYDDLDAMTAGFQPAELSIIAGRPSMGKTSLVMNAVGHASVEFGVPALVFSLEMSKESLVERLIASEARVDSTRLRGGQLEQRDWINLTKAASRINEAPIVIDDSAAPTLLDIRSRARKWRSGPGAGPLAIVAIDFLQLIDCRREKGENESIAVGRVAQGLKSLAKELKCPVVALSQLNRGVESRGDKRPSMADLRESGRIEEAADLIAFIYRDEVYNKDTSDKGIAEIIIGKQRNGPIGTVRLKFLNEYTRFESLSVAQGSPIRYRGPTRVPGEDDA